MRIRRFKRINYAAIDLAAVNVFVGGNNAGKSSLIQGLHFGVGLLQSIALSGVWKANTSLSPTQLIYSPAEDIYALGAGGKLFGDQNKVISLEFNLISGESCGVEGPEAETETCWSRLRMRTSRKGSPVLSDRSRFLPWARRSSKARELCVRRCPPQDIGAR